MRESSSVKNEGDHNGEHNESPADNCFSMIQVPVRRLLVLHHHHIIIIIIAFTYAIPR